MWYFYFTMIIINVTLDRLAKEAVQVVQLFSRECELGCHQSGATAFSRGSTRTATHFISPFCNRRVQNGNCDDLL